MKKENEKIKDIDKELIDIEKKLKKIKEAQVEAKEIEGVTKSYPLKKLSSLIKKSLRTGTLQLILSILLFTGAMSYLTTFVNKRVRQDQKIKEQNQLFIEGKQEKRRNNPAYGILSAILSPYNEKVGKNRLESPAKSLLKVIKAVNEQDKNSNIVNDQNSKYPKPNIKDFKVDMAELSLKGFGYTTEKGQKEDSYNGNPPLLFKYIDPKISVDTSTILIPPSEYACTYDKIKSNFNKAKGKKHSFNKISTSNNNCILKSTWESFKASLIIAKLDLRRIDTILGGLEQVYFVSFDGIFSHRVVDPELEQLKRVAEEQPMYRWEASSYAQYFIDPETKGQAYYESKAYLDIAGLGIVKTISIPVYDENKNIIGVICFDKQIPINEYLEYMTTNDTLRIEKYDQHHDKRQDIDWKYGAYKYQLFKLPFQDIKEKKSYNKSSNIISSIRMNLNSYINNYKDKNEYDQVNEVKDQEGLFRIILKRGKKYHHVLYISSNQINAQAEYIAPVFIVLTLIILSFIYLFKAASKTIAYNEKAGLANILRNLPIGVLELEKIDQNDVVKYGNDYAEEITGKVLDRFGESQRSKKEYYKDIIEFSSIVAKDWDSREKKLLLKKVDYKDIQNVRNLEGKTTSYFAKLKKKNGYGLEDEWIEITGSPILNIDSINDQTFGVFKKVRNSALLEKLNNLYKEVL